MDTQAHRQSQRLRVIDLLAEQSPTEIQLRLRRQKWPNTRFRPGFGYGQSAEAQIQFRPKHYAETVKLAWTV